MIQAFLNLGSYGLLVIGHVAGIVIAGGGVFVIDFVLVNCMKDGLVARREFEIISLVSRIVWIGLVVLVAFGLALVVLDPERLLSSPKFLAKMTIVAILIANGFLFHFRHLRIFERNIDIPLANSREFIRDERLLVASGAVSAVSWISAFVLGSLHSGAFSYFEIMFWYASLLALAMGIAFFLRKKIFSFLKNGS